MEIASFCTNRPLIETNIEYIYTVLTQFLVQ